MTGEQLQRLRQQGTAKFAEISSCHDGYLCHREANYQGVDMMTFRLTGQEKEKKNTAVPRCCGPRGTNITHIITKITSYCTQRKPTSICGRGRPSCGLQTRSSLQDSPRLRQVGRHVSYRRTNHTPSIDTSQTVDTEGQM